MEVVGGKVSRHWQSVCALQQSEGEREDFSRERERERERKELTN